MAPHAPYTINMEFQEVKHTKKNKIRESKKEIPLKQQKGEDSKNTNSQKN